MDAALRAAVAYAIERFEPVGVVAAGSLVRGEGGATSDLDLYVLHLAPFRQRVQRRFREVPTELFVNPPDAVRGYFASEHADGRPLTAHMLATGFVVLDRDPVVAALRAEAAEWLRRPAPLSPLAVEYGRYVPASSLDDARDVAESDPATAALFVAKAVHEALRYAFRREGRFAPRDKDLLSATAGRDPALAAAAREALLSTDLSARLRGAEEVARRALGVTGFYEWESVPDPVRAGSGRRKARTRTPSRARRSRSP